MISVWLSISWLLLMKRKLEHGDFNNRKKIGKMGTTSSKREEMNERIDDVLFMENFHFSGHGNRFSTYVSIANLFKRNFLCFYSPIFPLFLLTANVFSPLLSQFSI